MEDLPFGLARKDTFAALSPADLESMGKQASDMYLSGSMSLNDAVCKVAKAHPSISTHQVRRIIEYANNETFQRLFEKQAGDKNVEFPVADPGVILRSLEAPVLPAVMSPPPSDYGCEPVKTASRDLEADLLLMQAFGVDPSSGAIEKCAESLPPGSISPEEAAEIAKDIGASDLPIDQLRRGIEVEMEHNTEAGSTDVIKGDENESKRQAGRIAAAHIKEMDDYYTKLDKMEKKGSLIKQAEHYVKIRRPGHEKVAQDLRSATSLESIRQKTAAGYPEADPHGELIRTRQRLDRLHEEVCDACFKNDTLVKDASAELTHATIQHVLGGGNLGELIDAMASVNADPELLKTAMKAPITALLQRGVDQAVLTANTIIHDMTKKASRVVNPEHPAVRSYAALVKLAGGGVVLNDRRQAISDLIDEVNGVIMEAIGAQNQ